MKHEINEKWKKQYNFLEDLRKSGVTNMYGAVPYLMVYYQIDRNTASKILASWMDNYKELSIRYKWNKKKEEKGE